MNSRSRTKHIIELAKNNIACSKDTVGTSNETDINQLPNVSYFIIKLK